MAQLTAEHVPPSTLRVGVDLVRVADVAESLARFGDRYATRVYTADEREYCHSEVSQTAERYAARFAAKEAALKVLRPACNDAVAWQSIEIRRLSDGACEVHLRDEALALARRIGITELSVSMSHEPEYATAVVIARLRQGHIGTTPHSTNVVHADVRPAGRQSQSSQDA
jgi:holo-[acyl-carrier protein] synthase